MKQTMPFTNDQVEILYFQGMHRYSSFSLSLSFWPFSETIQDISNAHEIADCIHQRNFPAAVMDGATVGHRFFFSPQRHAFSPELSSSCTFSSLV